MENKLDILTDSEQRKLLKEYQNLSEEERCSIILNNIEKAVKTAESIKQELRVGKIWTSKTPGGELIVKAAILYRYAVIGAIEFSADSGIILPKGYHPTSFKSRISTHKLKKRAKEILKELMVLQAVEFREPERNFAVPLAYKGKIVSHIKISYDGEHVVPDYPVEQEMKNATIEFVRKAIDEWLFSITLVGLISTSLYIRKLPSYSFEDFRIVYVLFIFLIILKGLSNSGTIALITTRFGRGKRIPLKLLLLTAMLSMFITNDIALLTMVPLTLALRLKDTEKLIILEVLAANSASALTPFGNPQNIFIYYHYHVKVLEFLKAIWPFTAVALLVIFLLCIKGEDHKIAEEKQPSPKIGKDSYIYVSFFVLFIISMLRIIPLWISSIILFYTIIFDKKSLKVDYFLPLTFILFFGFTDNLKHVISIIFSSTDSLFFYTIFLSQFMSNVPATLFLADFTRHWEILLWGASVGGFGTLIGSLASFISYKLYCEQFGNPQKFLIRFHLYSFGMLAVGVGIYFFSH